MGFTPRHFPLMCCICFEGLTPETCVVDRDDVKWDCCPGQCAIDAGIEEKVDRLTIDEVLESLGLEREDVEGWENEGGLPKWDGPDSP